jgi:hypothetical protein
VIVGVEQVRRAGVGDHQVVAQRQHRPLGPAAGRQELLEQRPLPLAALLEQPRLDVVRRLADQRAHQQARVGAPAGHVDQPDHPPAQRVADRRAGARQRLEALDEVLVPEHVRGALLLERGADPVGADVLLRVAEARREQHLVEVGVQRAVAGPSVQHPGLRVGEDHAHARVGHFPLEAVEHRFGGGHQPAVLVDVVAIGGLALLDRDTPETRAAPGTQDDFADVAVQLTGGEKRLTCA